MPFWPFHGVSGLNPYLSSAYTTQFGLIRFQKWWSDDVVSLLFRPEKRVLPDEPPAACYSLVHAWIASMLICSWTCLHQISAPSSDQRNKRRPLTERHGTHVSSMWQNARWTNRHWTVNVFLDQHLSGNLGSLTNFLWKKEKKSFPDQCNYLGMSQWPKKWSYQPLSTPQYYFPMNRLYLININLLCLVTSRRLRRLPPVSTEAAGGRQAGPVR